MLSKYAIILLNAFYDLISVLSNKTSNKDQLAEFVYEYSVASSTTLPSYLTDNDGDNWKQKQQQQQQWQLYYGAGMILINVQKIATNKLKVLYPEQPLKANSVE